MRTGSLLHPALLRWLPGTSSKLAIDDLDTSSSKLVINPGNSHCLLSHQNLMCFYNIQCIRPVYVRDSGGDFIGRNHFEVPGYEQW